MLDERIALLSNNSTQTHRSRGMAKTTA